MANMAKAINNIRTFPVMNARTFSTGRPQGLLLRSRIKFVKLSKF